MKDFGAVLPSPFLLHPWEQPVSSPLHGLGGASESGPLLGMLLPLSLACLAPGDAQQVLSGCDS